MKKSMFIVTIILLLSLVATTSASAGIGRKLPTWENVFNPAEQIGEDAFTDSGIEFKGKLYFIFKDYGTEEEEFVWNQVWSTKDGRNWSFAWDANSILPGYDQIDHLSVFKDQLYAVLGDFEGDLPGVVVRTPDGLSWESVAEAPHYGDEEEGEVSQFSGKFTSFQGSLYAPITFYAWWPGDFMIYTRLWRTSSGDPGTWEDVFTFPNWMEGIASMATFKGALYVSSFWGANENGEPTVEIWRSFDGVSWEAVTMDGFGDPGNILSWGFGQKDGYIYIGLGNFEGGQIWRTKDGMNWQPVTTDGLGNPNNVAFSFVTYQNLLYTYSVNDQEGCIVYASKDGLHYTPANEPGWGDPANIAVWQDAAWVIFKGALYMGSYGPGGVYRLGPVVKGVQ